MQSTISPVSFSGTGGTGFPEIRGTEPLNIPQDTTESGTGFLSSAASSDNDFHVFDSASDDFFTRAFRYLLFNFHQLDWCSLRELSEGLMDKSAASADTGIDRVTLCQPHLYHREMNLDLLGCLERFDGKLFDVRCNFVGLDDAVRLRKHVTKSIKSQPAITWKERVYKTLVMHGCHSDEIGIELIELVNDPYLIMPLSLQRRREAVGGEFISVKETMREILEEDNRFDVRFQLQNERYKQFADSETLRRNGDREIVLEKPQKTVPRSKFAPEYSVFLREKPLYYIRFYGISATADEDNHFGKIDEPGMSGCGVSLHKLRLVPVSNNIGESRENQIWSQRKFIGNFAYRILAEYTALNLALKQCTAKGYVPLIVQGANKQVRNQMTAPSDPQFSIFQAISLFKQAKSMVTDLISQAQRTQFGISEYYNILNITAVPSKSKKLLQVTGKPSSFEKWADEGVDSSGNILGEVENNPANLVQFEVLDTADEGFYAAISLAREAQADGQMLDRGNEFRDVEIDPTTGKSGKLKLLYGQSSK